MSNFSRIKADRSTTLSNSTINSGRSSSIATDRSSPLLQVALEENNYVKEKMEECASKLSTINQTMKKEVSPVAGVSPKIKKALAQNEDVEDKVQECALKLKEIKTVLEEEMDDNRELKEELRQTREKLSVTSQVLSTMENVVTNAYVIAEQAKQQAMRDFVTGISSRELFNDHLEQAVAIANRTNLILAVMFIDLDRFKAINDTYGHAMGDTVLQMVAQRLNAQARSEDTVCRYGGDEFLYLLVNPKSPRNIQIIADKICNRISQPLIIGDLELTVGASIGIAVYPNNGSTPQELVEKADTAMYWAKEKGSAYAFFDQDKGLDAIGSRERTLK